MKRRVCVDVIYRELMLVKISNEKYTEHGLGAALLSESKDMPGVNVKSLEYFLDKAYLKRLKS